ncbi:MAG TPA: DUF4129 domain-containing protein [Anaerolineales bacterium]
MSGDKYLNESLRWNERVSSRVSHLLVGLMLTCLMITLVQFGEYLFPTWNGGYLPWATFVIALEAMYTKRAARNILILSREWAIYRGVELVVLLLALRVLLFLLGEPARSGLGLDAWQRDFFGNFFSGEYLIAAIMALIFWMLAGQFSEDLAELEGDEKLLAGEIPVNMSQERSRVRQQMVERIILYGAGMVILVSLIRIDLETFLGIRPAMRSTIINVVLYFVLALALFSQTQLAVLRASWSTQKIRLDLNIGARWAAYSILFLLILAILAVFLPTSYTMGFLSILGFGLSLFIFVLTVIWNLFLALIFIILSSFGLGQASDGPGQAPPAPPPMPPPIIAGEGPAWIEVIKSILFWVLFLGVIGFSIYQYGKQHGALWQELSRLPGVALLRKVLEWLRGGFRDANRALQNAADGAIDWFRTVRTSRAGTEVRRRINLRRLSARQKVLFYYLAMVRRGGETGIARQPDQTPYEYQLKLQASLPEIDRDLAALTEAFVEARYSRHEISEDQARLVRKWWERIRRTLRRWRKGAGN